MGTICRENHLHEISIKSSIGPMKLLWRDCGSNYASLYISGFENDGSS